MIPPAISAASVARAYASSDSGKPANLEGFGNAIQSALQGTIDVGHRADAQSAAAIAGVGNLTEVVTAVNRAEIALQTATAIRDRVVQAYQDIMRMPI